MRLIGSVSLRCSGSGKRSDFSVNYEPASTDELDQFGRWCSVGCPGYRQVIVTVPRQSGKSTVAQAFIKARAEATPVAAVVWHFENPG